MLMHSVLSIVYIYISSFSTPVILHLIIIAVIFIIMTIIIFSYQFIFLTSIQSTYYWFKL